MLCFLADTWVVRWTTQCIFWGVGGGVGPFVCCAFFLCFFVAHFGRLSLRSSIQINAIHQINACRQNIAINTTKWAIQIHLLQTRMTHHFMLLYYCYLIVVHWRSDSVISINAHLLVIDRLLQLLLPHFDGRRRWSHAKSEIITERFSFSILQLLLSSSSSSSKQWL